MGDVTAAVDRYTDMAPAVRERLKARMAKREYDDLVSIRRDSIAGKQNYDPAIRDMHFGNGSVCQTVNRNAWAPQAEERGLVYCEGQECILVPTVCRNVSRISRAPGGITTAAVPPAAGGTPPGEELVFAPPGAGSTAGEPSFASPAGGGPVGDTGPRLSLPPGPFLLPPIIPSAPIPGGFVPTSPVPEPASVALFAVGLAAVWGAARRRAARSR